MNSATLFEAYVNARNEKERIGNRARWDLENKQRLETQLARLSRQCRKLDSRLHARLKGHRELGYSCVICGGLECICDCEKFRAPANYMSTADLIARAKAAREVVAKNE